MTGLHCQFCGAALEALTIACPFCGAQPVLGERYELRALIGRGGMGEVFLGYDRRLANEVAIKRLPPQLASSAELRDSLTKEARIMARLSDGAIVRLFDLAEFYGDLYLILEYICGPSMRDMIRAGYRATPIELAQLMSGICQGLSVAHHAGVIHRDLKPSNLLLALEGAQRAAFIESRRLPERLPNPVVKITDFGIAKAIADSRSTMTNAFSGTPGYMAPEQFRGEAPSPQTDVYALGAITWELLTGKLPAVPMRAAEGVHPAVADVVAMAMAPQREVRFATAAGFYEALCNAIEGRSPRRHTIQPARVPSRNRLKLVLPVALLCFGIMMTVGILAHRGARKQQAVISNPFQDENLAAIEWHSLSRVAEVPPVVEDARGRVPGTGLTGPQHPKIKWTIALPLIGTLDIAAVGTDGTVYLSSSSEICAIRDGKLLWAYKTGMMGARDVHLDDDGRLWFHSMDNVYCLNRDGKGGRLPSSIKEPRTRESPFFGCSNINHTAWGPGWKLDLDGDCSSAGIIHRDDGSAYIATDLPEILSVSRSGRVQEKFAAQCNAMGMLAPLPSYLMYACEDRTIHGVVGAAERWKLLADGNLERKFLADSSGTVYYGDYGTEMHLHAVDADGKSHWKVDLHGATMSNMALDNRRQLFVTATKLHSRLICLGD